MKHNIIQMSATAGNFDFVFQVRNRLWMVSVTLILNGSPQKNFGADFGAVESFGHFSSKMSKEPPLRSVVSVTVPSFTNFLFQKLKKMT